LLLLLLLFVLLMMILLFFQVVKVPNYSAVNISLTAYLKPRAWNGFSGGIIAMRVAGDAKILGAVGTLIFPYSSFPPSFTIIPLYLLPRCESEGFPRGHVPDLNRRVMLVRPWCIAR
jgi:hypothetical protein